MADATTLTPVLSFLTGNVSAHPNLTALSGGAQAGTALVPGFNQFTTVAAGNDSAQLPFTYTAPGQVIFVVNAHASNSMNVYAQSGDTINAIAANSPFAVAAGKTAIFISPITGKWYSILTA